MRKGNWELGSNNYTPILGVIVTSGVSKRVIRLKKRCQLHFLEQTVGRPREEV